MKKKNNSKILMALLNIFYIGVILGILFFINYISIRHYKRFDVTKSKIFSLSERSVNILKGLDKDISITVFFGHSSLLYKKIENLLTEYQDISDKIHVEFVDPETDIARTQIIAQKYNIQTADRIIIESGNKIKHLTEPDLAEYDRMTTRYSGEPKIKSFKGEQGITSAILSITQEKQVTIAFIEGHGERIIESQKEKGLSQLKQALERNNARVFSIKLLGREKIEKKDIDIIAIISPLLKFTEQELKILEEYLMSGGSLFVAMDPISHKDFQTFHSGLEDLLEKFGFILKNAAIVDPAKPLPLVSPLNLFVDNFDNAHPITKNMVNTAIVLFLARPVEISSDKNTQKYDLVPLAYTTNQGWGESDLLDKNYSFDADSDIKGPVTVAAAAENPETRSKIVVIGDSDFMSNYQIGNVGNGLLALNALNWIAEKDELIDLPVRDIVSVHTSLSAKQMNIILVVVVVGFPVLIFLMGILVWWMRNRK